MEELLKEDYFKSYMAGVSAMQNKQYELAVQHLETALAKAKEKGVPSNSDIYETGYFNIGQSKKCLGDHFGTIENLIKAIDLNPERYEEAYIDVADSCFQIRSADFMEFGIKILKQCTAHFPNNIVAWMNIGIAYINLNDKESARKAFLKAKQLGNKDAAIYLEKYC